MKPSQALYTLHQDLKALTAFVYNQAKEDVASQLPAAMLVSDYRTMTLRSCVELDMNSLVARLQAEDPNLVRVVYSTGVRDTLIRHGWMKNENDKKPTPYNPSQVERIITHEALNKSMEYFRHAGGKNFKFKDCSYLVIQNSNLFGEDRTAFYEWAAVSLPQDTLILFC